MNNTRDKSQTKASGSFMRVSLLSKSIAALVASSSMVFSINATAQNQSDGNIEQEGSGIIEEVVTIGSRSKQARSAMESTVPVDVISADDLDKQGGRDILDALSSVVPSFNVGTEAISDAATLVRPANLRGLPADSTLILVNGKRHHKGAVIGEFVAGLNRGAQATDISSFFGMGTKQVEVLRDGAAAQYGSDAIAGVINFTLADDPEARRLQVQAGSYFEGDGDSITVSGLFGTHLGSDGFATLAFQVKDADATSRGSQAPRAQDLIDAGNTAVADPVVVWGSPEVKDDVKLIFNSAVEAGDNELYAFGNWGKRDVDGSFFYRNPARRAGIFVTDDSTLEAPIPLVFDLDTNDAQNCSSITLDSAGIISDPNNLTTGETPACFSYHQLFPGGFTPRFGGQVIDSSIVIGMRGDVNNSTSFDFSVSSGRNEVEYQILETVNGSFGPDSPTEFDLGSQIQLENLVNLDFVSTIDAGLTSDLSIAYGFQYHREEFQLVAGQTESSAAGPFADQGGSIGSNGFQGFSSDFTGKFARNSKSAYIDIETDLTDTLLVAAAFRYEDFSDFGDTFDGKLSARLNVAEGFNLRGAISTGFRAPSIGQSNLQRSATVFEDGNLVNSLTVPPTDGAAQILANQSIISAYNTANGTTVETINAQELTPEESVNFSFGAALELGAIDLTIDFFRIEVDDRITLRSNVGLNDDQRAILEQQGVRDFNVASISYFTNSLNTTTQGVDIVATLPLEYDNAGSGNLALAFNLTDTKIDDFTESFIDNTGELSQNEENLITEIERGVPDSRATLTYSHDIGAFSGLVRVNYYGETFELLLNESCCAVEIDPLVVLDIEGSWHINDTWTAAVGLKNITDEQPDHNYDFVGVGNLGPVGFLGADFAINHPAGLNGASYYFRLSADF